MWITKPACGRQVCFISNFGMPFGTSRRADNSTTLYAQPISDTAAYNWYDAAGNLLGSTMSLSVSPTSDQEYTLEVISMLDGFKDYDKVTVHVRQYFITSVSPKPATTQLSVGYDASAATTASLLFLLPNGSTFSSFSLDPAQSNISINTSSYPAGIYQIVLQANGQSVDARTIQIN